MDRNATISLLEAALGYAEQGLPVIRAANTGISALIDGRGQVVDALDMDVSGTIDAALPPPRPAPLYARTGDWPLGVLIAGLLFVSFLLRSRPA